MMDELSQLFISFGNDISFKKVQIILISIF